MKSSTKLLFEQCAKGSAQACEEAYASVRGVFSRTARRVSFEYGSPGDTEDLVQEIYLKLSSMRDAVAQALPDDENLVQGYLAILAANAARDWYRARGAIKRGVSATNSLDGSARNIEWALGHKSPIERNILLRQIEEALPGTDRERLVFRLFYRQGFSASQIAQIPALGLTTSGVESQLHRMSQAIRAKLGLKKGKAGGVRIHE